MRSVSLLHIPPHIEDTVPICATVARKIQPPKNAPSIPLEPVIIIDGFEQNAAKRLTVFQNLTT